MQLCTCCVYGCTVTFCNASCISFKHSLSAQAKQTQVFLQVEASALRFCQQTPFLITADEVTFLNGSGGNRPHSVFVVVGRLNVLHFSVPTFLLSGLLCATSQRATNRRNPKSLLQNNQERTDRSGTPLDTINGSDTSTTTPPACVKQHI